MKLQITTKKIKALKPCSNRFENWLKHYKDFDGDILEFLSLDKITARDKIWTALKLLPIDIIEVFAIDCAFAAADYAAYAAADAAYRANAAYYAADAAAANATNFAAAAFVA